MQSVLAAAEEAARLGGRILVERMGRAAVREKAPADLVTDADLASQTAIQQFLTSRFPAYAFLGEESDEADRQRAKESGQPIWVVDPLDGTANYVHRLPGFSVSIALIREGQPVAAIVYDPLAGTCYAADDSGKVVKNGRPIQSSECLVLEKALVCCSFRPGVGRQDPEVERFLNVLERSQSMRRLGSAAMNLCYVAEGCLDAYWATSVKAWDVAAGYLIARNAGASLSAVDGAHFDLWDPKFVASATPELHQQMLECLQA